MAFKQKRSTWPRLLDFFIFHIMFVTCVKLCMDLNKLHMLGLNTTRMPFSVFDYSQSFHDSPMFCFSTIMVMCFFSMFMICLSQAMIKKEFSFSRPFSAHSLIWRILVLYYVGIEVAHSPQSYLFAQMKYLEDTLQRGLTDSKTISTRLKINQKLSAKPLSLTRIKISAIWRSGNGRYAKRNIAPLTIMSGCSGRYIPVAAATHRYSYVSAAAKLKRKEKKPPYPL